MYPVIVRIHTTVLITSGSSILQDFLEVDYTCFFVFFFLGGGHTVYVAGINYMKSTLAHNTCRW